MIIGLGMDVCGIQRMAGILYRLEGRFEERVFTMAERVYCRNQAHPAQHFAARFAAKEAFLKALGVPDALAWRQMEVVHEAERRPTLYLSGAALLAAQRLGIQRLHLTLTHEQEVAIAVVVAEG